MASVVSFTAALAGGAVWVWTGELGLAVLALGLVAWAALLTVALGWMER
jgi:hypothetical protein